MIHYEYTQDNNDYSSYKCCKAFNLGIAKLEQVASWSMQHANAEPDDERNQRVSHRVKTVCKQRKAACCGGYKNLSSTDAK